LLHQKLKSINQSTMGASSDGKHFVFLEIDCIGSQAHSYYLFDNADSKVSEKYCSALLENNAAEIPEACKQYASVKAKLEARALDPFAGMSPGSKASVRHAQIKRRMSTRHGQGAPGKSSSWFGER
jgi:hypothetical protein